MPHVVAAAVAASLAGAAAVAVATSVILPQETQWIEMRDWRRGLVVSAPAVRTQAPPGVPPPPVEDLAASDISGQLEPFRTARSAVASEHNV